MTLNETVQNVKEFWNRTKLCKKQVYSQNSQQVSNEDEKNTYNSLAEQWFSDYSKTVLKYGVPCETIDKYDQAFKMLLKLSSTQSRRKSYQKQFDAICAKFNDDLIIFLQTEADESDATDNNEFDNQVQELLDKIIDKNENRYLQEAMGCWKCGFLRGATVLLWCSAIDRIHKVIEQGGFDNFNRTCLVMKNQVAGRFKKFNKEYSVQSISELRTVFDSDLLWILEGMQYIDTNERTRLASCFDMRNHSGHPGEAPITKFNVLSCFSDIVEIILANPKFALIENGVE